MWGSVSTAPPSTSSSSHKQGAAMGGRCNKADYRGWAHRQRPTHAPHLKKKTLHHLQETQRVTIELTTRADTPERAELRRAVRKLCEQFGKEYWQQRDLNREYPEEFVDALTKAGYLSAFIPTEYGGLGLGITEAAVILEEINRSGGHAAACHAQMYTMGALLRHGSEQQKKRYLPEIASGDLRLQAFSITEPHAGSDTPDITTFAAKGGDKYVVTGHRNWTSRVLQSDLLMLLARTEKRPENPAQRAHGIGLFRRSARCPRQRAGDIGVQPVRTMFNYATNQVWYKQMRMPVSALIGEEGDACAGAISSVHTVLAELHG
jgi:acyl-CoA dehydrogenase